jgi:hypothetical protein
MHKGLQELLTADTLVLLPGWRDSEAAKLNVRVGLATCMRFYEAKPNQFAGTDPLTDPPRIEWTFQEITGPLEHEPEGNSDSPRAALLTGAARLISGTSDASRPLRRTAEIMTALGYRHTELGANDPPCVTCGARQLQGHDSAVSMSAVRFTRITNEPADEANWKDLAAQVAYGYEAATMKAAS